MQGVKSHGQFSFHFCIQCFQGQMKSCLNYSKLPVNCGESEVTFTNWAKTHLLSSHPPYWKNVEVSSSFFLCRTSGCSLTCWLNNRKIEWRWQHLEEHRNTHTATHQTSHSACLCQPFIHSLPLHEAVKQTPLQVPKDPRGRGQEGEAERGWWDTLFKPHTHTHTHNHTLLLTPSPSFFPICLLPCIIHHPPCSPRSLCFRISFSLSLYHTDLSD